MVSRSSNQVLKAGRRKTSVAQVRMVAGGKGVVVINAKPVDQYFRGMFRQQQAVLAPLQSASEFSKDFDFHVKVYGGGITGQAEAARHGIARALATLEEKVKRLMRRDGFLTRDDRMVERKKPGQPKARKRFQYSKR